MKKVIIISIVGLLIYLPVQSQVYLKGYSGYSRSNGSEKTTYTESVYSSNKSGSYKLKIGQGINLGLSAGYKFHKNISFEITGNTLLFSTFNYSNPHVFDYTGAISYGQNGFFGNLEYSTRLFQFSPQIVFTSSPIDNWTFYLKGGPNFLITKFILQVDWNCYWLSVTELELYRQSISYTEKFTGKINTGFQGSFGVEYNLSKRLSVFTELTSVDTKYMFKEKTISQHKIDGVDSKSELEMITYRGLVDDEVGYSHFGLNIGLKYIFGLEK